MKSKKIKKIVLIGPESTGKTTLAIALAEYFQTAWVPEFAREYLQNLPRPYLETDLLTIAEGQIALEMDKEKNAQAFLFCDTDLIVLQIWSEYKFGKCHPWILDQIKTRTYDLYLLCGIDVPWTYDPLREDPHARVTLYKLYQSKLKFYQKKFIEIEGNPSERLQEAIEIVKDFWG